ncbi:WD repeat-containing protein 18, partial [Nowakowskiella sp. JEL0078]
MTQVVVAINGLDSNINVWDLNTGVSLAALRGNALTVGNKEAHTHDVGRILALANTPGSGNAPPSLVFSAQRKKAMIHTWNWLKEQPLSKFVIPEELSSVGVSNSGLFFVGGTKAGRVYLWQISTGTLIKAFDAHYKSINVIKFTSDDSAFVTGSDDALVNVWIMSKSISQHYMNEENEVLSQHTLAGHGLPVTDVVCGNGLVQYSRIFSVSLDSTCKIWHLNSGQLLSTLVFSAPLYSIIVDPAELQLFVGSAAGTIFNVNLRRWGNSAHGIFFVSSFSNFIEDFSGNDESNVRSFDGHGALINSLDLSFDASFLVSASDDGSIIVWDVESRMALRKLGSVDSAKAQSSNVRVIFKPPELLSQAEGINFSLTQFKPFNRFESTSESQTNEDRVFNYLSSEQPIAGLVGVHSQYGDILQQETATKTLKREAPEDIQKTNDDEDVEMEEKDESKNTLQENTLKRVKTKKR